MLNTKKPLRRAVMTIKGGMTTDEAQKTDFAKIGKELLFSKKGVFTDYGLLFRNEGIEFREIYDGQVFPQYSYYGDELFTVEMEYNGKREYLYLAEETRSIDKALARLGAKDYSDCKHQICDFNIESKIWLERFKAMLNKESIYAVNEAVKAVNFAGMDLEKLDALVRYVEDDSADTVKRLAEHIDDFKYIYYAEDYEDVGKYAAENIRGVDLPVELTDYIDYEAYGEHIVRECGGKFLKGGGFVYISGEISLDEILSQGTAIGEIK